jgi:hypothetical protein
MVLRGGRAECILKFSMIVAAAADEFFPEQAEQAVLGL